MKKVILEYKHVELIITRIAHQLVENHGSFENTAILALQPRGPFFGKVLAKKIKSLFKININYK